MGNTFIQKAFHRIRKFVANHILYGHFPYAYARFYYREHLGRGVNYRNPKDFNEKMFWLARYWQDPRIVSYADKLTVRDYLSELGLECYLPKVYAVYDTAEEIDFSVLPEKFVLKTNHAGGGLNMIICKDKSTLDEQQARKIIEKGLGEVIGMETCEYQYQYIRPRAYAEQFLECENGKLEVQFFCFNGRARHILVRNDLGDSSNRPFVISYSMDWERVPDRKNEDLSISIPRPRVLDEMIDIAIKLSAPFPQVRIDLYLLGDTIYFGEMTFSTSGNILWNYTDETVARWGKELILPQKLPVKWKDVFQSFKK